MKQKASETPKAGDKRQASITSFFKKPSSETEKQLGSQQSNTSASKTEHVPDKDFEDRDTEDEEETKPARASPAIAESEDAPPPKRRRLMKRTAVQEDSSASENEHDKENVKMCEKEEVPPADSGKGPVKAKVSASTAAFFAPRVKMEPTAPTTPKAPTPKATMAKACTPSPSSTKQVKSEDHSSAENGNGVPVDEDAKDMDKETEGAMAIVEIPKLAVPEGTYDVLGSATWKTGEAVPYLFLCKAFEHIEATTKRLEIIETLANCFRTIIAVSPKDLLPAMYLAANRIAPAHEGIELGLGDATLIKAIASATGRSASHLKEELESVGDLGLLAKTARSNQRALFTPAPLTLTAVFSALKWIATSAIGKDSQKKKTDKIQQLLVACRESEALYLIRCLQGKLRIGLAEQSILAALAQAIVLTPPGLALTAPPKSSKDKEKLHNALNNALLVIKAVYSEVPSYDVLVDVLLETHGDLEALRERCRLTPGVPVSPMLAKPTKGIVEVLNRFENTSFSCEYKYDGERAQIHCLENGKIEIFSRNSEHTTGKYPDLIKIIEKARKPGVTTTFVMDSEVVAFDKKTKKLLPFQTLSHRARKNVDEDSIKVQVCLFAFDLLYVNGRSLLKEPLRARRAALVEHFNLVEDEFSFAVHRDCTQTEEIEMFLTESVAAGCEGLMVKTLDTDATYEPSKRSLNWLKVKKDYIQGLTDSLDLVPIAGYYGKGKRTGVYGAYLLACYDDENEEYQSICKIGTGFSDERLDQFTAFFKEQVIPDARKYYRVEDTPNLKPDVWFEAAQVWEVLAADLSISPVHRAAVGLVDEAKGIALRFPRFIRIRDDKKPEQATSASQVAEMYKNQSLTQKTGDDEDGAEDDY
mmetsp:Transcript_12905/g.21082  ORF Transcript_12905/g.21082 Transcript_12905/m.21082 type:complete len:871 (-) Transcript_12905:497-3109(-)|eukprot:CAMPEP_0184336592 /NCGR_PEP_ID=MMETSP1089-20130417/4825_1 /TAXON_ID=38269 ORGANISM="Gloeochaete wittrockiana, Strain SAG46.84" /NCGR_SAMPLE_ID=MMETSP1089 /ASSEMBLY_ACC=CAM_ASM_000445 /LENGTH=870 /DNA_ID=CAMNT_0026661641 /DNA_START=8 /DNA_END=2620 /DNA_ORIENTATION=+